MAQRAVLYNTLNTFPAKDKFVQQLVLLAMCNINALITEKKKCDFLMPLTVIYVPPVGLFAGNVLSCEYMNDIYI